MLKHLIPDTGLRLQHDELDSTTSSQAIRLDVPKDQLVELIRTAKSGGDLRLKTGKNLRLLMGSKHISLYNVPNKFPQETFSCPLDSSKPAYFTGKFNHVLEVQQAKEATAGVDEALQKLKNNLKQSQESREATPEHSLNSNLLGSQHRKSAFANAISGSRPSSPFLGAASSPHLGPTSAPKLGSQSQAEKIKQAAIRIPVIHLLASEPRTLQQLKDILRVNKHDLDNVLYKVAGEKNGKQELRDRAYRDLDPWNFPYTSQSDRQAAIDRAISSFDRQRIDKLEPVWQMLLDKQDRGKGIYLSRLNLSGMQQTGRSTPRLGEKTTDSGSTEGKSLKSAASDSTSQRAPSSKSSKLSEKSTSAKIVKAIKSTNAVDKAASATKSSSTAPAQESRYKSSEKIEDSDEEADSVPSIPAPKKHETSKSHSQTPEKRPSPAVQNGSSHKPHPSSSSGSSTDQDRGRLTPSSDMVRTRGGKETARLEDSTKIAKPEGSTSRNPSRARNGSSPNKPSPLGSSPPTNSRDVDSSSITSNSTSLSSAPSSPPAKADSSRAQSRRYSPVAESTKPQKQVNGVKRKAQTAQDVPPAKKQQLTNGEHKVGRLSGLAKLSDKDNSERPVVKRNHSDSSAASGSDAKYTKDGLIEEAKSFHKFYAKYKTLHDKLHALPDAERDDADLDKLWKMHVRLKDIKDEIWKEWGKLEKAEKL